MKLITLHLRKRKVWHIKDLFKAEAITWKTKDAGKSETRAKVGGQGVEEVNLGNY